MSKLPRFRLVELGSIPSSMSVSEYSECERSINRGNRVRLVLNMVLEVIEKWVFG